VALILRLILFSFLAELGISYSLHAEVRSLPEPHLTKEYTNHNCHFLNSVITDCNLLLIEFFEKDEQSEVNEDETIGFNGFIFNNQLNITTLFYPETTLLKPFSKYLSSTYFRPFFIIFHSWKIHI